MLMAKLIYATVGSILFVCASYADERTYTGLLKREIKEKIIKANEVIRQKELDRYRTISILVNDQLVYCHYEPLSENNLPLIICY
tara:strand:- start:82 stop:336 length:255 start_codon:yes stop_codon:yes gene_type:complete